MMKWLHAETVEVRRDLYYLVKTNGAEWHDLDLFVWPGAMVAEKMRREILRGRPVWLCVVEPTPDNDPLDAERDIASIMIDAGDEPIG